MYCFDFTIIISVGGVIPHREKFKVQDAYDELLIICNSYKGQALEA
jgi:hypothetical protein